MKKLTLTLIAAALLLAACKEKSSQDTEPVATSDMVMTDMVDIDAITECEDIIADSSLMNGLGDKAWRRVGNGMIRIKNGSRYYLRKMTKNGTVTAFTYSYDDNNTPQ